MFIKHHYIIEITADLNNIIKLPGRELNVRIIKIQSWTNQFSVHIERGIFVNVKT